MTRGRGVTVHQKDCRVVFHLDAERRVDVEWDGGVATGAQDPREGHLARRAGAPREDHEDDLRGRHQHRRRARRTHADRTATQSFDLWVADVRTLRAVMKEIERIKGVHWVERMRA